MTIEIILLALASAVRPTSLVAVYTLVRQRSPSRLMTAYVVTGLAFTVAAGATIVWASGGIELHAGSNRAQAIAEILAGAVALGFAGAILAGRLRVDEIKKVPPAASPDGRPEHRQITIRAAAVAGPATHIPGLLYILALDLIVLQEPAVTGGLLEIGIYNVIWFGVPIFVLAICALNPSAARTLMTAVQRWSGAHARTIVLLICFGMGGWLLAKGATSI